MESLLLGGAQSVGKSTALYGLATRLVDRGFRSVAGSLPLTFGDFKVVLEGNNKDHEKIRIIINSAADTVAIIEEFKNFLEKNGTYDILISSIRDDGFWPRQEFFSIMGLNPNENLLEIPLGKVTRRNSNKKNARDWYRNRMDNLIDYILSTGPYNI